MHALAVFAQRRIRALQVSGQPVPRVNGPDFWDTCRKRFFSDEVSTEERQTCERIAKANSSRPRRSRMNVPLIETPDAASILLHENLPGHYVPSPLDPVLDTRALRPDQVCGCCGKVGAEHRRPLSHFSSMLRAEAHNIESLQAGKATLATFPMSESRYAAEKAQAGGVKGLAGEFRYNTCHVGRDLGGVAEEMPGRRRCGVICKHELSERHLSFYNQLKRYFKNVVQSAGGIKQIQNLQPSRPYAQIKNLRSSRPRAQFEKRV